MQQATRADCQTYFKTCFWVFFTKSNFGAICAHSTLSVLLEWDSITGRAAALSENMKHSSVLLWPRENTKGSADLFNDTWAAFKMKGQSTRHLCGFDRKKVKQIDTFKYEKEHVCTKGDTRCLISYCTDDSTSERQQSVISLMKL